MTVETRPVEVPAREKSVADVLRHAARIIEERGWHHGSYESAGRLCALGAINTATSGDYLVIPTVAMDAAAALWEHIDGSILDWNDAPGRTATEVIAALHAAADAWEAEHHV